MSTEESLTLISLIVLILLQVTQIVQMLLKFHKEEQRQEQIIRLHVENHRDIRHIWDTVSNGSSSIASSTGTGDVDFGSGCPQSWIPTIDPYGEADSLGGRVSGDLASAPAPALCDEACV